MLIRAVAATLVLLTVSSGSLGQDDAGQSSAGGAASEGEASQAGNGPAETAPKAAEQPARSPSDPFDYESSEQISEDLSVSFPVDI